MIPSKQWLIDNGYQGLYEPSTCGCQISDLAPCGTEPSELDCKPGYKHMDPRPDHKGDWAIFSCKESPGVEDWENIGY